jgi:flagellar protein FliL
MADSATTGNPTNNSAVAPQKGRRLLVIILALVVLAIGAWSGGYFFTQRSQAKTAAERGKRTANADAEAEEGSAADETRPKDKAKSAALALPDDSMVKQVIELQPYIVNLADPGEARYLRLTISVGLGGEDATGEKPGPLFMVRVRNAMLAVLTTKTSQEVLTVEGKAKLRRDLLRAARAASTEPKVEAVYITEFIVQL